MLSDIPVASSASMAFADPLSFRSSDESALKGNTDPAAVGKGDGNVALKEVISLITGFFSGNENFCVFECRQFFVFCGFWCRRTTGSACIVSIV